MTVDDVDALIRRTVAAVAPGYRALDLANAAGLLLDTYWDGEPEQLYASAVELKAGEVTPDVYRDGYQEELGYPEIDHDSDTWALCVQLNRLVNTAEEGDALLSAYFVALADAVHHDLGIPVLAADVEMPIAEQLARQLGSHAGEDPLDGLDVLVRWPLDDHRIAAVWRGKRGFEASARAPHEPTGVFFNTDIGRDPEVRAGWLLPGAVSVALQDRKRAWHEARVGETAWLCVLPQRAGNHDPPIVYRDVEGTEFERGVAAEGLPALWPVQAPEPDQPHQSSDTVLGFSGGGWHLWVLGVVGIEFPDTAYRPIPGSILGRPHGFGLQDSGRDHWRAVAVCGSFKVEIEANGPPPERLDLRPADSRHFP